MLSIVFKALALKNNIFYEGQVWLMNLYVLVNLKNTDKKKKIGCIYLWPKKSRSFSVVQGKIWVYVF